MSLRERAAEDWANFRCKTCKAQYSVEKMLKTHLVAIHIKGMCFDGVECSVCGALYVNGVRGDLARELERFNAGHTLLRQHGFEQVRMNISWANVVAECDEPGYWNDYANESYLGFLYSALTIAKSSVHFVTYGWPSNEIVGALKMLTQMQSGLVVRGVVSCPHGSKSKGYLLKTGAAGDDETLRIRKVNADSKWGANLPHQKILVIDNTAAFYGSANLTATAYDKIGKGLEQLRVEARPQHVMSLHNQLFSPAWVIANKRQDGPYIHWLRGSEFMPGQYLAGTRNKSIPVGDLPGFERVERKRSGRGGDP